MTGRARHALVLFAVAAASTAVSALQTRGADHVVPSRPETVVWGWIPIDRPPVATVQPGQTVRIDTLSHHGATQAEPPETLLGPYGVRPNEILQDVRDFWASRAGRPREGRGGAHILTGPIAIAGAEPGDMLEVQILELTPRVPWGVNTTGPASGVLGPDYPGTRPGDRTLDIPAGTRHVIRTSRVNGRDVAILADDIHVPLAPFMGIMAVAPRAPAVGEPGVTIAGVQSSTPPGPYGGNMDLKDLTAGSTLYLPVFHRGALFYVGDPHGVQGNGEVSGNALEQSLTGLFRFRVHKGKSIALPRAETPTHYILMGIDLDLDRAMRTAVLETVSFLVAEKGLTPAKAFSLASLAADFQVAEAVDQVQLVAAKIPKSLFPKK
ncbi:MAG: acetamidase/formamidase family protein [Acidobacteria bacterium]|nr:acetamidase/formamidase family protein [Acidobacteriota bacterium]